MVRVDAGFLAVTAREEMRRILTRERAHREGSALMLVFPVRTAHTVVGCEIAEPGGSDSIRAAVNEHCRGGVSR